MDTTVVSGGKNIKINFTVKQARVWDFWILGRVWLIDCIDCAEDMFVVNAGDNDAMKIMDMVSANDDKDQLSWWFFFHSIFLITSYIVSFLLQSLILKNAFLIARCNHTNQTDLTADGTSQEKVRAGGPANSWSMPSQFIFISWFSLLWAK